MPFYQRQRHTGHAVTADEPLQQQRAAAALYPDLVVGTGDPVDELLDRLAADAGEALWGAEMRVTLSYVANLQPDFPGRAAQLDVEQARYRWDGAERRRAVGRGDPGDRH